MNLNQYVQNLNTRYQTGISREHSYRGDLQNLLSALLPDYLITNEPARLTDVGKPDYVITKKGIQVGYIEAKDIGIDLKSKSLKEQFNRYLGLPNIIFTDYMDFHFYRDGNFVTKIAIAEIQGGKIISFPDNFDTFNGLVKNFADTISQTIKSPTKLAEMMAARTKLMAGVINDALDADDEKKENSALKGQMQTFKTVLIHDITNRAFADLYAQTIAYGMFAARYHDPTLPTFSRQEAATLIPKTNPFLRRLFQDIAGYDLDDRLVWIVDELVQIFLASDVAEIMHNFGTRTKQEDPVIHFYETFLAAYDPALRKARGVWYTPEPVVNFIVRAVDDILKTEFGLSQGLADTSKTKIKVEVQGKKVEKEVHKVQILDPATGTGTFLAEVVRQIHQKFEGQKGIWSNYVENNLIPRLNGFELLMASYAMAHLKLDLLLTETGFKPTKDQRFRVYLTNSLDESHPDAGTLFSHWLSEEANEANKVKREAPVMVVLGNPPYSGESANKGTWIKSLMEDYKKEPGGKEKLKERNPKWINDDYVKFIRYGQYFIERNGEGVLAFINPHGFLDNPTFRGMRWNLLKTYDKIYTIDLHGNSKKKETAPDGSLDVNVFDIMQGVSINLFIKTGKKKTNELGKVYHLDLFGSRNFKYEFLFKNSISTVNYQALEVLPPNYFFVQKDFRAQAVYTNGFSITDLMPINNMGVTTGNDTEYIGFSRNELTKYFEGHFTQKISYRPFDSRYIYYNPEVLARARFSFMRHVEKPNICLSMIRRTRNGVFGGCFVTLNIVDKCITSTLDNANVFPLYLYPSENTQMSTVEPERIPNLNATIIQNIAPKIGLRFTNEKKPGADTFAPIDILDYIYAVLHSPTYRETYKEFLKIDFPRVPYPKDAATFWALVTLGSQLRQVHLLESPAVEKNLTQYPEDGDNVIRKTRYEAGNVYINETQYFANVPPSAWNFYIGGYQPAQKWLKDRKDRVLDFEDVGHYRRIIAALVETDRLMGEVDKIGVV